MTVLHLLYNPLRAVGKNFYQIATNIFWPRIVKSFIQWNSTLAQLWHREPGKSTFVSLELHIQRFDQAERDTDTNIILRI